MDFAHLHVHSNFSLLQGAMGIPDIIRTAHEISAPCMALTDTNGLYGAVEFYETARAEGIKPIIGSEIVHGDEQCVLLAMNGDGYANLCRIVSERKLAGTSHYGPFLRKGCHPEDAERAFDTSRSVAADPTGLVALTASPALLQRLHAVMPSGRLYAELRADTGGSFETRCPTLRGRVAGHPRPVEHLHDVAASLGVPRAATVNANFLEPSDRTTHTFLSAIRENMMLQEIASRPEMLASSLACLMPPTQVENRLPGAREALRNTMRIAEMCNLDLDLGTPRFPRADLPPHETVAGRLRAITMAGARRRYGEPDERVRRRIERELDVITKLNFCDYFLLVADIVEYAKREGIPHVGRGSAANSIVSYCLGISAVDPLKFDLYFERFLNEYRTDVPDIDIDFSWRRRDDVIDYVYRRYGTDRVAMVSTHNTMRARSAFRDVARVMGLPMNEINALSHRLPHFAASSIGEAMETFPEMADFPIDKEPWGTVVRTALRIDGYVRHLGIHLGGLVIGDRPLNHYTALENSTKGILVTQYEMQSAQRMGLVKMDLLGQRSLTIVSEAARNVERLRGVHVDLDALLQNEPKTAALLRQGRTMGCFQIESPGMRQLLQMLHARDIMGLIQALSLIRPGPSSSGMKDAFIRRMRGYEPVSYPTPQMEHALSGTRGVMLYQEDILRVAKEVAGFSLAEGDELRKAISKARSREAIERFHDRFRSGAARRGVRKDVAEGIWKQIVSFAAYSYCKAHACTYGHISYQASYLKAHWPAEFLASVIANKAGFYDARTYFEDARRSNVRILPPCINRSAVETQPEPSAEPAIRPGLELVKSLSLGTIRRILEHRAARRFDSLEDFCARVNPSAEELENLILAGALDSFGHSRPTLLMCMEHLQTTPPKPGNLFGPGYRGAARIQVPEQAPYSIEHRILLEMSVLGFSHTGHPLDAWAPALADRGPLTPSLQLKRMIGRRVRFAGWLVTMRRALTRHSEYMKFLTLEDHHGVVEIIVFPDVYKACGNNIAGAGVYMVTGHVNEKNGVITIVAKDVRPVPCAQHQPVHN